MNCMSASRVFFYLTKCPEMVLWKTIIFDFKRLKKHRKTAGTTKICIVSVWFRMILWSLSHSLKPWSYGMCSYCRDPKKQKKRRRWLALRGCLFGGQANLNKAFPCTTSQIWISTICWNSSRVNRASRSRDNDHGPRWWNLVKPPYRHVSVVDKTKRRAHLSWAPWSFRRRHYGLLFT
jgi:hypothetical protein